MIKPLTNIYQFKITLKDTKPEIWRRIQVPASYTFWDFHVAIQNAMGWFDCHIHEFYIAGKKIGMPDDNFGSNVLEGWKEKIADYFSLSKPKADYLYDFGDDWKHEVILEKIVDAEPNIEYPICLDGARACPPEDCGGTWGYEELIEILKDPNHEEYEDRIEWLGEGYDPERFSPEEIDFHDPQIRFKMQFGTPEDYDEGAKQLGLNLPPHDGFMLP